MDPLPPDAAGPLTLDHTSARLGEYVWVEERLFESTGRWAADLAAGGDDPELAVLLATASRRHGEHAELWRALAPRTHEHDPDAAVAAPAWAAGLTADSPPRDVAALVEVLAALAAAYLEHLQRANPPADGTYVRAIGRVLVDIDDERLALDDRR